jgi:nucleotidyltransferase/DNA polymerase involved in DNA repair
MISQVRWFACVFLRAPADPARLLDLARECSPRVEVVRETAVVVDASGMTKLFGGPRGFGEHVLNAAATRGLTVSVALAGTRTAALLMAGARPEVIVVPHGHEAESLAGLPIGGLAAFDRTGPVESAAAARRRPVTSPGRNYRMAPRPGADPAFVKDPATSRRPASGARDEAEMLPTLERWGLHTLGDLAALPAADLYARLGEAGVRWRRLARGEEDHPLVPEMEEERFEASLDLEWPVEGLEPLSFVLARLLEPLCARLERCDRGAVALRLWLKLVSRAVHHRCLQLPAPMRDPKVLRTLLLLDLESHAPGAGVDRVTIAADPAPGRIVQFSLLTRPLPSPDRISTLMARLCALMGEERCGMPALVDSHRPGAFSMAPFAPAGTEVLRPSSPGPLPAPDVQRAMTSGPASALRRFRRPVPARVVVEHDRPVRVATSHAGLAGGAVTGAAGPWRTSGEWWQAQSGRSTSSGGDRKAATGDPEGRLVQVADGRTAPGAGAAAGRRATRGSWDRDEWDVALSDRAVYRLERDRTTNRWFVEGIWD